MRTNSSCFRRLIACAGATATLLCGTTLAQPAHTSLYTDITTSACFLDDRPSEHPYPEYICRGAAAYRLRWILADLREDLVVITPDGTEQPMHLTQVVSGGFSRLGPKAEWRMLPDDAGKVLPAALIVRYNAVADVETLREASYLVVVKITPSEICVTDTIEPQANANVLARQMADQAASKPCLRSDL